MSTFPSNKKGLPGKPFFIIGFALKGYNHSYPKLFNKWHVRNFIAMLFPMPF